MDISVGILCGGKSSRMGENKAFLKYNNVSFLENLVKIFYDGKRQIIISKTTAQDYEEVLEESVKSLSKKADGIKNDIKGTDNEIKKHISVVNDELHEIGPLEGLRQVLKASDTEYVFVCAVDMPYMKKELMEYMAGYISSDFDVYCMRDEEHFHPLCAIYSKKVLPYIEEMAEKGEHKLGILLKRVNTKYIGLKYTCFDEKVLYNINTPEEYKDKASGNDRKIIFAVSGNSNSGKTTLTVKLIKEFVKRGYKVAAIKHDGHDYKMDYEGTDSFRHYEAGAYVSAICTGEKYSINAKGGFDLEVFIDAHRDVDVFILEGFKRSGYPKLELLRRESFEDRVCSEPVIAVVTDFDEVPGGTDKRVFGFSDEKDIADYILTGIF